MSEPLHIAVVVPPMTQLNTPYPALPQLAGHLRAAGHRVTPVDLSLETALALFSRDGLRYCFDAVRAAGVPDGYDELVANAGRYERVIEPVVRFLQGHDAALAGRIVRQAWIPQGPRFGMIGEDTELAHFGASGQHDHARFLATLMIQDLADCFRLAIAPAFGLTSYGSQIAESASSFDPLAAHLDADPDAIEALMLARAETLIPTAIDLLCLTCPFPGNLPAALRIGQWARTARPDARSMLGGGYPSTELRDLTDPRIFAHVDAIVLDDGEAPLERWCARMGGSDEPLHRTATADGAGGVRWHRDETLADPHHRSLAAPDYSDIDLGRYLDLLDTLNPMHRMWNEGRWLKLTAAHGCYWKRCTFCDISLPYIERYEPAPARILADRMDALHAQTGQSGFHFTDEAAPPVLLVNLALELLRRGRSYHWWGNIRFDPQFTPERCRLLAAAGMVAVSGGLEVADDDLLKKIDKGVSVPQAARVSKAFADAGILVHAYLMYGFPGQSEQATIDSLEHVRQLIANGCITSGFWHRFTASAHSPVGRDSARFGIRITGPAFHGFARNNLEHVDPTGADHDRFDHGLAAAMQAWLAGIDLDADVRGWFSTDVPRPSVASDAIARALDEPPPTADHDRLVWLGEEPFTEEAIVHACDESGDLISIELEEPADADAIADTLRAACPRHWENSKPPRIEALCAATGIDSEMLDALGEAGLVRV